MKKNLLLIIIVNLILLIILGFLIVKLNEQEKGVKMITNDVEKNVKQDISMVAMAKATRIKASMNSINPQMFMKKIGDIDGKYKKVEEVEKELTAYIENDGGIIEESHVSLDGQSYCFQVILPFKNESWCIDSNKYSGSTSNCSSQHFSCE